MVATTLQRPYVSRISGGSYIDLAPVLSYDSSYIFVGTRIGDILVFSSKTAAQLGILPCRERLLGLDVAKDALEPHLVAAYTPADGGGNDDVVMKIRVWNYESGDVLRFIPVRADFPASSVRGLLVLWTQPQPQFFLTRALEGDALCDVLRILSVTSAKGKWRGPERPASVDTTHLALKAVHADPRAVRAQAELNFIAGVGPKGLKCLTFSPERMEKFKSVTSGNRPYLCLALHPHEETVAAGDVTGRIVVWRDVFSANPVQSIIHWHNNPLHCLQFSCEGSYILSGGAECCVVKSALDASNTREFLFSLSAPIVHLTSSPDDTCCVTAHADNGIKLISRETNLVKGVIQGLTRHFQQADEEPTYPAGIVVDPRTKGVILNGLPGHLQFCAVDPFELLCNFDVTVQNYPSEERERKLVPIDVAAVRFSEPDGKWMATVETRDDFVHAAEIRLKFWLWSRVHQGYKLQSVVELPETARSVSGLEFQPPNPAQARPPFLVLTTKDDSIRCFSQLGRAAEGEFGDDDDDDDDGVDDDIPWECVDSSSYERLVPRALAFSVDGSLVAVGYSNAVVIWNPEPLLARSRIQWPSSFAPSSEFDGGDDDVGHVVFGRFSASHLLLAASRKKVICWSLLDMRPMWCVALNVERLFVDPATDHCAVLTAEKKFYVFRPTNPESKKVADLSKFSEKSGKLKVLAAAFLSTRPASVAFSEFCDAGRKPPADIVFLSSTPQLHRLSFRRERGGVSAVAGADRDEVVVVESDAAVERPSMAPVLDAMTPFGRLVAERLGLAAKEKESAGRGVDAEAVDSDTSMRKSTREFLGKFMNLPSHSLPGLSALCRGFVQAVVADAESKKKTKKRPTELVVPEIDEDVEDDVEGGADSDVDDGAKAAADDLASQAKSPETVDSESEYDDVPMVSFGFMKLFEHVDAGDSGVSEDVNSVES